MLKHFFGLWIYHSDLKYSHGLWSGLLFEIWEALQKSTVNSFQKFAFTSEIEYHVLHVLCVP